MKKFLCLLLVILVVFEIFALPAKKKDDSLERILSAMTLRDKVAQMMIASFRVWKEVPETESAEQPLEKPPAVNITELNDEIRDMITRDHFGGILLFGENIQDAEQTLRLIADLQSTNRSGGGLPQMIFARIDEMMRLIRHISRFVTMPAIETKI